MSAPYNDDTLSRAMQHVQKIQADLGGTELLKPLQDILSIPAYDRYPRQLMILTDGDIENKQETITFVKSQANTTRVFMFGIGSQVSQDLIRGLAEAGNGKAEFVRDGDRLQTKVMKHLNYALSPGLSYASLDWGGLQVSQAPKTLPPVFEGKLLIVYGFLNSDQATSVKFSAVSSAGPISLTIPVNPKNSGEGQLVHRLATKALLKVKQCISSFFFFVC